MQDVRVELKVCEGCGGLWLRARGHTSSGAYCNSCARWLSEFPAPKRTRNSAQRMRRHRNRASRSAGGSKGLQAPESGVDKNGALAPEVVR
jgi:hypothetical protein